MAFDELPLWAKLTILLCIGIAASIVVGIAIAADTDSTIDVIINGTSNMTQIIDNSSYVIVSYENETPDVIVIATPTPTPEPIDNMPPLRIMQGQCVEVGKKYDIGGIGWWTGYIGWYGTYMDAYSPENESLKYAAEIPYSVSGLASYYIDPKIFSSRLGYWYMVYGKAESAANNRLFYVSKNCKPVPVENVTQTPANLTVVNNLLRPKPGNGYVLAKGDPVPYPTGIGNTSSVWLFKDPDVASYNRPYSRGDNESADQTMMINKGEFDSVADGIIDVAIVTAGNNGISEITYNATTQSLDSVFVGKNSVSTKGMTPSQVFSTLKEYALGTIDDKVSIYKIDIADPTLLITRMDENRESSNVSYVTIRGYTNAMAGAEISVDIDKVESNNYVPVTPTITSKAFGDNPYEWRQFVVVVPLRYMDNDFGDHNVIAKASNGAYASAQMYIRKELESNYNPPTYVSWVDNSPYLEPVVVEKEVIKEVPVVVEKVIVQKEVLDYDKLASEELRQLLPIVIGAIVAAIIAIYLVWAIARTYARRLSEKKEEIDHG